MKKILNLKSKFFISLIMIFLFFILIMPIFLKLNNILIKVEKLQNEVDLFFDGKQTNEILKINKKKYLIIDISKIDKTKINQILDIVE